MKGMDPYLKKQLTKKYTDMVMQVRDLGKQKGNTGNLAEELHSIDEI